MTAPNRTNRDRYEWYAWTRVILGTPYNYLYRYYNQFFTWQLAAFLATISFKTTWKIFDKVIGIGFLCGIFYCFHYWRRCRFCRLNNQSLVTVRVCQTLGHNPSIYCHTGSLVPDNLKINGSNDINISNMACHGVLINLSTIVHAIKRQIIIFIYRCKPIK